MPRDGFTFACTECKMENYISKKNKKNTPEKVELKKYCPKCNASKVHKEKK
ncbi:50S ribosomal protein L33 [Mycoplasma tauri]|uniref:Large ribosomal subunit protein bL33 n=1 Tax=Mycoplasma tauri TaxID=547987 RepID=A0A953T4M0_9MOLU|nr:50S ribosomal protein L33 [Mycoplasma tauri]MBZ4195135.1 50S ribosomal protein L33 [Mycoplasma tauri]MBZ4203668.1 50S ribosomal protein L33 [Mycoplasma tauri]MBZ4204268.1 50S ribosomal protein L33 [Mycoplasma tauri]MBZ4212410.1 50S ribosomal protein L33 [Mycoplasma tauri]MBZ4218162.1 50S ribosomal protein L33 [Mycoplasma tauri]